MNNVEDIYPLSPMQQGMLFSALLSPESGVYVEQIHCAIRGDLNVSAFRQAWQFATRRHVTLRTAFVSAGVKEPVQVVRRSVDVPFVFEDLRDLPGAERDRRFESWLMEDRARGFKLTAAPLMSVLVARTGDDRYRFAWTYHHLLLDGWSVPIVMQDVLSAYAACEHGAVPSLDPVRPYRDYVLWVRQQDARRAEEFWRGRLAGFRAPTPLGVDSATPAESGRRPARTFVLAPDLSSALDGFARRHHLTLNTVLQGAWALLLSRYSGERDVVFGVTLAGRPPELKGADRMAGLFINTLPARFDVPPGASVVPWLRGLQAQQAELSQYTYCALTEIQGWSEEPRGLPLFESIFVFENYPIAASADAAGNGSLRIEEDVEFVSETNLPLVIAVSARQGIALEVGYDPGRFEEAAIERLGGHFETILAGFAAGPEGQLGEVPWLTAAERAHLAAWSAGADVPELSRPLIHECFEQHAAERPDAVAVVCGGREWTYQEVNRRANGVAHSLIRRGAGPETRVAVALERSVESLIALLAIWKAGAAYVPLGPNHPPARLAFAIQDCGASLVITRDRLEEDESTENPGRRVDPASLAYVIYTSGSTGTPKGTLIPHGGVSNFLHASAGAIGLGSSDRTLHYASLTFDLSILEIGLWAVSGGALCIAGPEVTAGLDLIEFLRRHRVSFIGMTPSMLSMLPSDDLPLIGKLFAGGEACPREVVARWLPGRRFFNAYGPTEVSIGCTMWELREAREPVPIGRALPNTSMHILDSRLRPVPAGVRGELHIGGVGVGRGYLGRPELTAERFIPDPFSKVPGARMYRSGDLARYLSDGTVEYLGRSDDQAKIRGLRIELGEIEAALREHPAVAEAAVVVRGAAENKRLVAYFVARANAGGDIDRELRPWLLARLPEYMAPMHYVRLEKMPTGASGKLDRRALPDFAGEDSARSYVAPRDVIEARLAAAYEEVLGVERVGATDDFFALGGHSLLAVRLVGLIEKGLGRKVPLVEVIAHPTVEGLAERLRQDVSEFTAPLVTLQPKGEAPPLFFVHPSGGSVHWYEALARRLGKERPFHGLQARGLNGDRALDTSIEQMAAAYVDEIRAVQPQGPYHVGSWSLGVIIAYEMARQIERLGERVAVLALVDQGPRPPGKAASDDAEYLVRLFAKHVPLSVDVLRGLAPEQQVEHVLAETKRAKLFPGDVTLAQFWQWLTIMRTEDRAWRKYVPQPYGGRIDLFRATDRDDDEPVPPDLGWAALAAGGVEIHDVKGDHLSIMYEPKRLAVQLKACLAGAQAAAASR